MKQHIRRILASLAVLPVLLFVAPLVSAADPVDVLCDTKNNPTASNNILCDSSGTAQNDIFDIVQTVINILLIASGIVAVIMIIIGGFRYITSNGDANAATSARNTIMYAVIGLIIAGLAFVIVNFVVTQFK